MAWHVGSPADKYFRFFITEIARKSFLQSPGSIGVNMSPWATAVDPRTATLVMSNHAEALYTLRRANCNGFQHSSIKVSLDFTLRPKTIL